MSVNDILDLASLVTPKAVFMTIHAGNMTDGNVNFNVPYAAKILPMDDKEIKKIGAVATYNAPLKGTCNASTGAGTISMTDALPARATIDYADRSVIPVAGANAVIALQDFTMAGTAKGKGVYDFQFGKVTVYLPDGTTRSVKLDSPISMSYDVGQMKLTVESNPKAAGIMADMLKSGATFPANAAPVRLNDILAAT